MQKRGQAAVEVLSQPAKDDAHADGHHRDRREVQVARGGAALHVPPDVGVKVAQDAPDEVGRGDACGALRLQKAAASLDVGIDVVNAAALIRGSVMRNIVDLGATRG